MPFFLFKSILASVFLLAGIIAVICMLTLMGKAERKISATFLRRMHKGAGFVFSLLLVVISYFCIKYWIMAGDALSTRAVFHGVLALGLFIVLVLKLSIVQFYKQFLRFVPQMGMIVFILAFVVFSTSGGYYFLRTFCAPKGGKDISTSPKVILEGENKSGNLLFQSKCSGCHYADRVASKVGPGLKNILKNETLPYSKKPATPENIKKQLERPALTMPSFATLSEQELSNLLAYLKTL